jgi:hypothetical protein
MCMCPYLRRAGSSGDQSANVPMHCLFGLPSWQSLAKPLFRAVQTTVGWGLEMPATKMCGVFVQWCEPLGQVQICSLLQVLACTRNRPAAGGSKRDSPTDALLAAAMKALEEMVGLAARCGALESLMAELPLPTPGTGQQAEVQPPLAGTCYQRPRIIVMCWPSLLLNMEVWV